MHDESFPARMWGIGPWPFVKSLDFIAGIVALFSLFILFDGRYPASTSQELLNTIAIVSASLFGLILTGLAIVTSFTDKEFIYAWKRIERFDDMVTQFQFNLYLPIVSLIGSLALRYVRYNGLAMILFLAFFTYMLFSLMSLVTFVCQYGLQRGEFVKQQIENGDQQSGGDDGSSTRDVSEEERTFSEQELLEIQGKMQELEELREEKRKWEEER